MGRARRSRPIAAEPIGAQRVDRDQDHPIGRGSRIATARREQRGREGDPRRPRMRPQRAAVLSRSASEVPPPHVPNHGNASPPRAGGWRSGARGASAVLPRPASLALGCAATRRGWPRSARSRRRIRSVERRLPRAAQDRAAEPTTAVLALVHTCDRRARVAAQKAAALGATISALAYCSRPPTPDPDSTRVRAAAHVLEVDPDVRRRWHRASANLAARNRRPPTRHLPPRRALSAELCVGLFTPRC